MKPYLVGMDPVTGAWHVLRTEDDHLIAVGCATAEAAMRIVAKFTNRPKGVDRMGNDVDLVRDLVSEITGTDQASLERKSRLADLGIDSLARVELAISIEDKFDIRVLEDDVESMDTIGEIVDLIKGKIKHRR